MSFIFDKFASYVFVGEWDIQVNDSHSRSRSNLLFSKSRLPCHPVPFLPGPTRPVKILQEAKIANAWKAALEKEEVE